MDIRKPIPSSVSSLLAKMHGEGHFPAKESSYNYAITSKNVHSSTLSTPIKTSCGRQAQPQTPTSTQAFVSASGEQRIFEGCKASEDAAVTRTPLRLLAVNNRHASMFSRSLLELLGSPALKGKAKRVFVMPELLSSPARRVPVNRKSNQALNAMRQSPCFTPKKPPCPTPNFNKALDDGHYHNAFQRKAEIAELPRRGLSCLPQRTPLSTSSRAIHVLNAPCEKHGDHDAHVEKIANSLLPKRMRAFTYQQSPPISSRVNHVLNTNCLKQDGHDAHVKKVENFELPKRMLAFTHQQPPCATPISSTKDITKQHYTATLRDDGKKPDRLALLLKSAPHLFTPGRVKLKQPSKKVPPQHNEKKPSKSVSSLETPKASRTGVTKKRSFWKTLGAKGESTDKAKQQCGNTDEISVGEPKHHDAREKTTENAQPQCSDNVDHETSVCESKQRDDAREESTKKAMQQCGDDGVHEISPVDSDNLAECTNNLNARKSLRHQCDIKDSNVKHCKEKKPGKKLKTSTSSANVKQCKEKPLKKTNSLETSKTCKTGQPRVQTCRNHAKTVDARQKITNKAKQHSGDAVDESKQHNNGGLCVEKTDHLNAAL